MGALDWVSLGTVTVKTGWPVSRSVSRARISTSGWKARPGLMPVALLYMNRTPCALNPVMSIGSVIAQASPATATHAAPL